MDQTQTIALYQPMLQAIAYNLVRCKADAEDIVQETFLKWLTLGPAKIENIKAYLIKAVTNNCLNHLQRLQKKKEELFDAVSIKELVQRFKEINFAHLDIDINIQAALKIVYTKLEPLERAVYLLKEVFDFDYDALQETLNRKKEHCRQLFCRAKKKLQAEAPLQKVADKPSFLENFKQACHFGHIAELIEELKKDAFGKKP